jgi:hypothetical protein
MLAYCGSRLLDLGCDQVELPLIAHMLVSISQWDVDLIEVFFASGTKSLYKPHDVLKDYATQRGWTDAKRVSLDKSWHQGVMDCFDGVESCHAAWHNAAGDKSKVDRMLWRAQAAVLLPKIEMHRMALAPLICKKMRFPYIKGEYKFNDVNDVEIGNLAYFASDTRHMAAGPIVDFVRKLREVRNDLAHLKVLEEHRATDRELLLPYDLTRR